MKSLIKTYIDFHAKAEKLKSTMRHSWLTNPKRQESSAEHTWMLCLMAILFHDQLKTKVDLLKSLKMLIIHDLAEAITGDIPAFEVSVRQNDKYQKEVEAFQALVKDLPKEQAQEIISLFEEFEARTTPEAKFASSLDKVEVLMQHNLADISTWDQGDFNVHPYYKDGHFDFDAFMREFKDVVDVQSMEKIVKAKAHTRIDVRHVERYERTKKTL